MKILGRTVLAPWHIKWFGPTGLWTETLNYTVFLKIGPYAVRIPKLLKMGGSCNTTTLIVQFIKYSYDKENRHWTEKAKECAFCWRPDVTWENFDRKSYYAFKRRQHEKKYGPFKTSVR